MSLYQERSQIVTFLKQHPLGALATVGPLGAPELAAIYVLVDHDLSCLFVTKSSTRKYKNACVRKHGTLLVCDEVSLRSAEISGSIECISDPVVAARITEQFEAITESRQAFALPPIAQIEAGHYVLCRLVPHSVRFLTFAKESKQPRVPSSVHIML